MKIKMQCHEANHVCDKNQYKEAGFWEKVRLNIHLIYCRACRKYTVGNSKLTKAMKSPKVQMADKVALKQRFQQELSK